MNIAYGYLSSADGEYKTGQNATEENVARCAEKFPDNIYMFRNIDDFLDPFEIIRHALLLRMNGEDERMTWRDWDTMAENYLRARS